MKRLLVIMAGLALLGTLMANVMVERYVARVWFDDLDDFYVMYGHEADWGMFEITDLTYSTSAGTYTLPADFTPPGELPFVVNFSQVIPGFTVQRGEDFFIAASDYVIPYEELRWGPQNDISVHLRPLATGQSAVQTWVSIWDGWDYYNINTWAKDNQTLCIDPYIPFSTYTLDVHLEYGNGSPASGIPIYSDHLGYADPNASSWYVTDADGNWQRNDWAIRRSLLVIDPVTQEPAIQELLFPEPGESYQFSAVLSSTASVDPALTPAAGVLKLQPSLLNRASGRRLTLKYESPTALGQAAELRLYDLRGRFLSGREMPASGETHWDLAELGSGIYYVSLRSRAKILARARLTVIR